MVSGKKSILKREYIKNCNNYYTDQEMNDELILNMFQKTSYYFASKH